MCKPNAPLPQLNSLQAQGSSQAAGGPCCPAPPGGMVAGRGALPAAIKCTQHEGAKQENQKACSHSTTGRRAALPPPPLLPRICRPGQRAGATHWYTEFVPGASRPCCLGGRGTQETGTARPPQKNSPSAQAQNCAHACRRRPPPPRGGRHPAPTTTTPLDADSSSQPRGCAEVCCGPAVNLAVGVRNHRTTFFLDDGAVGDGRVLDDDDDAVPDHVTLLLLGRLLQGGKGGGGECVCVCGGGGRIGWGELCEWRARSGDRGGVDTGWRSGGEQLSHSAALYTTAKAPSPACAPCRG